MPFFCQGKCAQDSEESQDTACGGHAAAKTFQLTVHAVA